MVEDAVKLCFALYRVTELFPSGEPLCHKLREAGLNIVSLAVLSEKSNRPFSHGNADEVDEAAKQFAVLYAFMDIARLQKLAHERNFNVLAQAYEGLEKKIRDGQRGNNASGNVLENKFQVPSPLTPLVSSREIDSSSQTAVSVIGPAQSLTFRQKKLLNEIDARGPMSPMALFAKFPDVNSRTILRDIEKLEALCLIEGRGNTRNREYYICG